MGAPLGNTNKRGSCKPGLEAIQVPSLRDIAWAAGIWEGEGSCTYTSRRSTNVSVAQKDTWLLYRLKDLFGGTITFRKPYGNPKNVNLWGISGARARGFLMTIYSFMSPRRKEQIKFALGLRDNPNVRVA